MRPSTRPRWRSAIAQGVPVLVLLALLSCRKTEPARGIPIDAAEQVRPRPQELAYVTLKVVGMT